MFGQPTSQHLGRVVHPPYEPLMQAFRRRRIHGVVRLPHCGIDAPVGEIRRHNELLHACMQGRGLVAHRPKANSLTSSSGRSRSTIASGLSADHSGLRIASACKSPPADLRSDWGRSGAIRGKRLHLFLRAREAVKQPTATL